MSRLIDAYYSSFIGRMVQQAGLACCPLLTMNLADGDEPFPPLSVRGRPPVLATVSSFTPNQLPTPFEGRFGLKDADIVTQPSGHSIRRRSQFCGQNGQCQQDFRIFLPIRYPSQARPFQ